MDILVQHRFAKPGCEHITCYFYSKDYCPGDCYYMGPMDPKQKPSTASKDAVRNRSASTSVSTSSAPTSDESLDTDKGKEKRCRERCPECNHVGNSLYFHITKGDKRSTGTLFGIKYCRRCNLVFPIRTDPKPNVKQVGEEKECGDCAFNELKHREDKCDNCVILSNWKPKDTVEDKDL